MKPALAMVLWLFFQTTDPVEATEDVLNWSPPARVAAGSMGPFGDATGEPFRWRLDCRIESTAPGRRYLVAHAGWADVPGWRIDGPALLAHLASGAADGPRRPRVRAGAALLYTPGGRFRLMSARPAAVERRRADHTLHGSIFFDSLAVARIGRWISVYDSTGVRVHRVRLEAEP